MQTGNSGLSGESYGNGRAVGPGIGRICLALGAMLLAIFTSPCAEAQMSGLNATAAEVAQLPPFCWAQMGVPNSDGPEFKPNDCGAGTNHYCPGLVILYRAKTNPDKGKAFRMLDRVDQDIRYTEKWIEKSPHCSIRQHLLATKEEVHRLRLVYDTARKERKK